LPSLAPSKVRLRNSVGAIILGPTLCTRAAVRRALAGGAALIMVPVVRDTGRSAKANVSMDAGMLQAIDEEAAAHGLTRSVAAAGLSLSNRP